MTGDPFRPLPAKEDYKADLARGMGEYDEPERAPEGASVGYVIIIAAMVCIALVATFTEWL